MNLPWVQQMGGLLHKPQQKDQSYLAKRLYNSGLLL